MMNQQYYDTDKAIAFSIQHNQLRLCVRIALGYVGVVVLTLCSSLAHAELRTGWYYTNGGISQFLNNCSATVPISEGLWTQICIGSTQGADADSGVFQPMAVFTATGTGGKYIGTVHFQTWFNGKENTDTLASLGCSWGMLQPGQSIVCVGEIELVIPGDSMGAGFHLDPGSQPIAVVGRKF